MTTRTCEICLKEYPRRSGIYTCSMVCRDERTRRKRLAERYEDRPCAICGTPFSTARKSAEKLCGMACVGENNRRLKAGRELVPHEDVVCKNPGCDAVVRRRVTDVKKEFCSRRCRSQLLYFENGMKDKLVSKNFLCVLNSGKEILVRSRWEAAFIKDYLEPKGFVWEHESRSIDLPDGRRYLPDFYIVDDDLFVEVKGFERGPSLEKVKLARSLGHSVVYADARVLTSVFGLDLSAKHLASVVKDVV